MMNEGCGETGGKVEIAGRSLIGVGRREWKIERWNLAFHLQRKTSDRFVKRQETTTTTKGANEKSYQRRRKREREKQEVNGKPDPAMRALSSNGRVRRQ